MLPPIATCTELQSSGPLVSCRGPPRGAAGEVRRGIDGKDQSQEDDPETESEREIAPARFQGNRRCHSAGNPRDVAPDNQDRADFRNRPPHTGQYRRQQAEAPEPEQGANSADPPYAVEDIEFAVFPPKVLDDLPCYCRHDRRHEYRLRDHHSRRGEKESEVPQGTRTRQQDIDEQARNHRRQPHQGVHDYNRGVSPWKPQHRERSAEWQPERGCQKNSREADTERKRDDPDKSGIARKNKLPSSSEGGGKIVQGEPLQTE